VLTVNVDEVFPKGTIELTQDNKFVVKVNTPGGMYMGELMPVENFFQQNVVRNPKPNPMLVQSLMIEARRNIVANIRGLREVYACYVTLHSYVFSALEERS